MDKFNEVYQRSPAEAQQYSEMYAVWERRLESEQRKKQE
ncbi:hypothetical protein [Pasteurella phage PHB01]|uniref:Uncharacterized protein n=2 Tax=Wuhanvirus TaxID=2731989 RepID=A0A218M4D2_9CAUD|nr:hypothetical protein HOR83_gp10 [Pasteurella phage PHB01]ASD51024.1 hypothetical protein [Pasteurella phage PHB01]QNL29326.1 hypothetical protein [Pasteurella phage vB_PmuP_Pa7]UIS73856.1 hypothetical protein [Pasteurella phage vB_PmuP_PS07]UIS74026.1 hypothetical protein [Pasteurella phage vB_PmuP_PS30]